MDTSSDSKLPTATLYARRRLTRVTRKLGAGKDGSVFRLRNWNAVKIHARRESFESELATYQRLREHRADSVVGFAIPQLRGFAEDILAIEMTIVYPPFVLDFASAVLDRPLEFPDDVVAEWHQRLEEQFGEHVAEAHQIIHALGEQYGVYLYDLHRHNIKFRGD